MIEITFHKNFKKNYEKRIKNNSKLTDLFRKRTEQFIVDPECRYLHNHKLIGDLKDCFSFSVSGDVRVVYCWIEKDKVLFLDIGSHNQVY